MAESTPSSASSSDTITFPLKWRAEAFDVTLPLTSTVLDLKRAVERKTGVPAASAKVLGLKLSAPVGGGGGPSRPPSDNDALSSLAPPKAGGPRLMVMGTPAAAAAAVEAAAAEASKASGDGGGGLLDEDDDADAAALEAEAADDDPSTIASDPDNQEKLRRRISSFELVIRNEPRPGTRALVLDIDYTIFDLGSAAERPEDLARPHLHEFMSAAYEAGYDLFIWSANSMRWIEVKMRELGCSDHEGYKLTAYLDAWAMVTVRSRRHGVYDAKPLPLLWAKLAEKGYGEGRFGPHNTVMFDDLRRNYVFNPRQGLVIRPFRKSFRSRATDRELVKLKHYLLAASRLSDEEFSSLDHDRWEKWLRREVPGGREALREVEREVEAVRAALEDREQTSGNGEGLPPPPSA